jgi:hypothetical protein
MMDTSGRHHSGKKVITAIANMHERRQKGHHGHCQHA